jgi:hypothetical protein
LIDVFMKLLNSDVKIKAGFLGGGEGLRDEGTEGLRDGGNGIMESRGRKSEFGNDCHPEYMSKKYFNLSW